ncbi:LysR family transcriptional regulator [Pigmentiphaga aceris]|uniref:LysR family transcriptional regulator n=1 Tax=Pigmentiphaga aceris TaxID=1940612 RepID=A0A5C0B1Y0_9BURK|nr:LysR family transcriptional regulator [Pigmentiphaga aceris]QEI08738.1 LysR family transcriptional regulator [Pigmentiphaga aceris]
MKPLDVEAVQAFLMVAELKSFTRAAELMDSTQSAISLKIKRLEEGVGRRLLERTPRLVRLSAAGTAFLEPARQFVAAHEGAVASFGDKPRRLVVGISHHVVGSELPGMLRQLGRSASGLQIDMRVASSADLLDAFDRGLLDVAIVLRHDNRRLDGEVILEETFGWMAAPDFDWQRNAPLRLAAQAAPCSVRQMAVDALGEAGIAWTEVFVGGGLMTVGAAASAGLAVAALGQRVAPRDTVDVGTRLGLPPLPSRDVVLYATATDAQARSALRALRAALRATAA